MSDMKVDTITDSVGTGPVDLSKGLILPVTTVTGSSAIAVTAGTVLNATGTLTTTLPTAIGNTGVVINFKKTTGTGVWTIDGNGAETIDGSTTITLNGNNTHSRIQSDGSNWILLDDYDYQELDISSSGDFDASQSGTPLRVARTSQIASLSFENLTHTSLSGPTSAAAFLPAEFRPAADIRSLYATGPSSIRMIIVNASGLLVWDYKDYTGSSTALTATAPGTISWVIDV